MLLLSTETINLNGQSYLFSTLIDITERKKAEDVLRESEVRFRSLFENSFDAVLLTKPDGNILSANPAACRMFNMSEEEIQKAGRSGIVVIDERAEPAIKQRAQTGKVKAEFTFRRKDGSTFEGEASSSLFTDADGTTKTSMIIRDITERKKAEEALKESERLYKTVFDSSQDAFQLVELIYDKAGKPVDELVLKVNAAYEVQTGFKANQVVGKKMTEYAPNIESYWLELSDEVLKTGKTMHIENYSQDTKRYYDAYCFPYSKNIVGILFRDVTERKNLEKQLQDKERMATIGATAGMVGHDLRNPLQSIVGEVFLAKTELKSIPESEAKANLQESIQAIAEQISYMDKIVSDLQTFVKPVEANKQTVQLKPLITGLLAQIDIPPSIQTSLQVADGLSVVADPQLLKRVLINLVTNAVQAMPEGGELTIKAQPDAESQVQIVVEDTGVGISEEVKPNIFTPLFTTKSKGQGFGLAVCKRVIEAQGGTISLESEVGKGTKFIIQLPAK